MPVPPFYLPPEAPWFGAAVLELLRQGWGVRLRPYGGGVRAWAVAEDGRQLQASGDAAEVLQVLLRQADWAHLAELDPGEAALEQHRVQAQRVRDLLADYVQSHPMPEASGQ